MDDTGTDPIPTANDAMVLLTILNAPVGDQAREAVELLWTYDEPPSFAVFVRDHAPGSIGYQQVMALLTVGERVGTFVKNGVLHRGLALDLIAMHAVWNRCSSIVHDLRDHRGNPKLFENMEWLANQSPGS
ncbi:MAG: DUF4760 domain-containing protein [Acidimicrobiales bacterium]